MNLFFKNCKVKIFTGQENQQEEIFDEEELATIKDALGITTEHYWHQVAKDGTEYNCMSTTLDCLEKLKEKLEKVIKEKKK